MEVDIILLSNATRPNLADITQQAIDSCHKSEATIKFNIIVLEQNTEVKYRDASTHHINEPFNYNRFMNIGVRMTSNEYVCLCNNDLQFKTGWATALIGAMEANYLLSASPICPFIQGRKFRSHDNLSYGYRNHYEMSGWCIMTNRLLYDIIGEIDEDFPFWFADNAYSEQLKKHNVKHALVRSSVVTHLGSKTLKTLEQATQDEYTMGLARKFIEKYPNNESAIFFAKQLRIK